MWTYCLLVAFVCQAFAEALQHNNTLTTLNLEGNYIGAEGGKARVGVWGAWCGLCLLVVFVCQALAEALQRNNTLTTLNVPHNEIGDEGGKAHVGVGEPGALIASLLLLSARLSLKLSGTTTR